MEKVEKREREGGVGVGGDESEPAGEAALLPARKSRSARFLLRNRLRERDRPTAVGILEAEVADVAKTETAAANEREAVARRWATGEAKFG